MPEVSVQIANRNYELACGDGEEERVQELAAYVDEKVTGLRRQLPGTPEVKLLVFAALILADESREARGIAKAAESAKASATDSAETLATATGLELSKHANGRVKVTGTVNERTPATAGARDDSRGAPTSSQPGGAGAQHALSTLTVHSISPAEGSCRR